MPDLQSSLIQTIYLTFDHNQAALAFFTGIVISILFALYKPSRISLILILSFTFLLLGFEYNKHISQPLLDQTLSSLDLNGQKRNASKFISIFISTLIPILLYILGWGLLYLGIFLSLYKINKLERRLKENL